MNKYDFKFVDEDYPPIASASGSRIPISELISIDPECIELELEKQSAWSAVIGFAHAQAEADVAAQSRLLSTYRAELAMDLRRNMLRKLGIKPTEGSISDAIDMDETYCEMCDNLNELKRKELMLKVAERAMHSKKEMLINLSASMRKIMN
jgi:hypothetical protein